MSLPDDENQDEGDEEEMGGLFRVATKTKKKKDPSLQYQLNGVDSSKFILESIQDWDLQEVCYCYLKHSDPDVIYQAQNFVIYGFYGHWKCIISIAISHCVFVIQVIDGISDCFVTGKWEAANDAETLLQEDGRNFQIEDTL